MNNLMMYQSLVLKVNLNIFLIIFFLIVGTKTHANSSEIDSLKNELLNSKNDTTLVSLYGQIGDNFYYKGQNDSAIYYWEIGKKEGLIAQEKELPKIHQFVLHKKLAVLHNDLAYLYIGKGKFDQAVQYFNECIYYKQKTNDKKGEIQTFTNLGYLYINKNQIDSAIFYNVTAYKLAKQNSLELQAAICSMQIGVLHVKNGAISLALKRFNESIDTFKKEKDNKALSVAYNNLAKAYESVEKNNEALEFFFKSLSIKLDIDDKKGAAIVYNNIGACYQKIEEIELAIKYNKKALDLFSELKHQVGKATTLNNIGMMHFKIYQLDTAYIYYNESLEIRRSINDIEGVAISLLNISKIYHEQESYNKAIENLLEAFEIVNEIKNTSLIVDCSMQLYKNYDKLNDYKKALYYFKYYEKYNAILFSEKNLKKVNTQLKTDEISQRNYKDSLNTVLQLKNNKDIWKSEIEKDAYIVSKNTVFFLFIVFIGVLGLLIYLLIKRR